MSDEIESDGKLNQLITQISQQEWFQQLQNHWNNLDPRVRLGLKIGSLGIGGLIVFSFVVSMFLSIQGLRNDVNNKAALLSYIRSAKLESDTLKSRTKGRGSLSQSMVSWEPYIKGLTNGTAVPADKLVIVPQESNKTVDSASGIVESLFEIKLADVNLAGLIDYIVKMETGAQSIKVRKIEIQAPKAQEPVSGSVFISGFTVKE